MVFSISLIRIVSVSSNSKNSGSNPVSLSIFFTISAKLYFKNCFADMFTAQVSLCPFSCQILFCLQVSLKIHSPRGIIKSVSSAIGINWYGGKIPFSGEFHRTSD